MLTPSKKALPSAFFMIFIFLFVLIILRYFLQGFMSSAFYAPWLVASGVFFFGVFYPKQLGLLAVILLGLIDDGISGTPFGLHAIGLVTIYHFAKQQTQTLQGQPFVVCWTGFMVNAAIAFALVSCSMLLFSVPLTWSLLWHFCATCLGFIFVYPVALWLEGKITRSSL